MQNNKGFTLVELMITLVISGILVAAIYSVYTLQQKTYTAQDQVVEMQQNIRAATLTMVSELRMAGHGLSTNQIESAESTSIEFNMDLDDDGNSTDPNENITYSLDNDNTLRRETNSGGAQPIAENIEAIEFFYTLVDDSTVPATITTTSDPTKLSDIRTIAISILARAGWQDPIFSNDTEYFTASDAQWGAFNDNFRRRLLITTVQCRNMGL